MSYYIFFFFLNNEKETKKIGIRKIQFFIHDCGFVIGFIVVWMKGNKKKKQTTTQMNWNLYLLSRNWLKWILKLIVKKLWKEKGDNKVIKTKKTYLNFI